MADLPTLFSGILTGALGALDASEKAHLLAHVQAVEKLGGQVDLAGVLDAINGGWLPDYFAAAELNVSAQLAMSTSRQQVVQAQGGVNIGPIQLTGSLAETTARGENTNVTVTCTLERQSRSKAMSNAFDALLTTPGPSILPQTPATPSLSGK